MVGIFMTELERLAQIEEAWARRAVFAEAMAAERLADYMARRELGRVGDFAGQMVSRVAPRDVVRKNPAKKRTERLYEVVPAVPPRRRAKPVLHREAEDEKPTNVVTAFAPLPGAPKKTANFP